MSINKRENQTNSLRIALTVAFEKGADVVDELILTARRNVAENMQYKCKE